MENSKCNISSEVINSRYLEENLYYFDTMYSSLKKEHNQFKKSEDYYNVKEKFVSFMKEINGIDFPEYISEYDYQLMDDKILNEDINNYRDIISDDKIYELFINYYKRVNLRYINLKLKYLKASKILQSYVKEDRIDMIRFFSIEEKLNILSDLIFTEQELLSSVIYDITHGKEKNRSIVYDFLNQSINSLEPEYQSIINMLNDNRLEEFNRLNKDPLESIKITKHNSLLLILKM